MYNLNSKNNINSVKEVQDEEDGEMEKSGEQRLQERGPDVRELGKKRVSIVMEPLGARNDEGEERADRKKKVWAPGIFARRASNVGLEFFPLAEMGVVAEVPVDEDEVKNYQNIAP